MQRPQLHHLPLGTVAQRRRRLSRDHPPVAKPLLGFSLLLEGRDGERPVFGMGFRALAKGQCGTKYEVQKQK